MDDTQRYAREAIRLIDFHFSPEMANNLKRTGNDFEWNLFPAELVDFVGKDAWRILPNDVFYGPVTGIDHFISSIIPIFHPTVLIQIRSNLASFDAIAGVECTDAFLGQRAICDWIKHIATEFLKLLQALHPYEIALASRETSSSSASAETPEKGSSSFATTTATPEKHHSTVAQLDGTSDMFDVPTDRTVQQVILRGRTVLEGWTANETTRQLSMMKKGQERLRHDPENLDSTWTPRQAGANPVYHGSTIIDKEWPQYFNAATFEALEPRTNSNQMVNDAFAVIYTAFSPLRAFLWAAFQGKFPCMSHSAQDVLRTHETWVSGGRTYHGVVLFKFNAKKPAPAGLTHYVIPEGEEGKWGLRSLRGNNKNINKKRVWNYYRDIHGQSGDVFPDVVHGLEYDQQLNALRPFHTNMWRTIWRADAASDYLNTQHAATYAISFEFDSPVEAPSGATKTMEKQGGNKDKDKDQGKEYKKDKGALGRRLKNCLYLFQSPLRSLFQGQLESTSRLVKSDRGTT
ncbi:hypothetical protein LX36DRAFT_709248 [Colletotrichum falcatum]|nr:hypothetical protein LX36DRAFT_709248 [Colletotrichum falcatum]